MIISYKMVPVFEYLFYQLTDQVKLLCDFNEPEGLAACEAVIARIEELDTDDDDFPQSQIETVQSVMELVSRRKEIDC